MDFEKGRQESSMQFFGEGKREQELLASCRGLASHSRNGWISGWFQQEANMVLQFITWSSLQHSQCKCSLTHTKFSTNSTFVHQSRKQPTSICRAVFGNRTSKQDCVQRETLNVQNLFRKTGFTGAQRIKGRWLI